MSLRYTGAKIPGRGFDGGVGKCVIYRDCVQRELNLQEVIDILSNPDLNKLSTMPPVRPRGGTMYLFRCPDFETRHDLRADQYLWCQQGTKKMPKEDPVVKRFYMYIRMEEPVKNQSKRPKKTFTKYDVRFKKCEYELINAEEPLVLVHYTGDENVWKPFRRHMTNEDSQYERFQGIRATDIDDIDESGLLEGYEDTPRDNGHGRSFLRFHNRPRGATAAVDPSPKKLRFSEAIDDSELANEIVAATETIATGNEESVESSTEPVVAVVTEVMEDGSVVPTGSAPEDFTTTTQINEIRQRFEMLWPTFDIIQHSKLHGFVRGLSVIPQTIVTAASSSMLVVINDLAQLSGAGKTDRFEFYYVSAGPLACGYYLSTLLFRHCLFESEPAVPIAFSVHERRSSSDHRRLFELIKEKCPDVALTPCIFITDREYGQIPRVIPKAIQLYSWHYIEDDVVNWVESNGGTPAESSAYLSDVQALMKSKDLEKFHRELAVKRKLWPTSFASYFDTCLKADILSKGGRWRSEGVAPGIYDPFCGVVVPSCNYLNELVADLVSWQEASLEQVLQCLYLFTEYYAREIERGMHALGSLTLLPKFSHYARPPRRLRSFPDILFNDPTDIVNFVRESSI